METARNDSTSNRRDYVTTATTKIPSHQLETYFDKFSKHFLLHESTNAVDVEVVAPDWGDQFEAEGGHLRGITYDRKDVWVVEEEDGFIKALEIVRPDDVREIVRINRLGVRTT